MNISYIKNGNYLLPDLKLENKERFHIGKYGLLKLDYLKKNKRIEYINLLMSDKLNYYLHDIDVICNGMEERLIKELTEKESIDEKLKSNNQMLWISKMNSIKSRVEEIITTEFIYTN